VTAAEADAGSTLKQAGAIAMQVPHAPQEAHLAQ
jgi:hypothetical protein